MLKLRGLDTPYPQNPNDDDKVRFKDDIASYQTNQWTDFVVHTRFDSGSAGVTQIWVNGILAFDYKGSTYYRGHGAPYPKFGLYNGWRTRNLPGETVTKRTLFHDEYRFAWGSAGSYAAVSPGTHEQTVMIKAPELRRVD